MKGYELVLWLVSPLVTLDVLPFLSRYAKRKPFFQLKVQKSCTFSVKMVSEKGERLDAGVEPPRTNLCRAPPSPFPTGINRHSYSGIRIAPEFSLSFPVTNAGVK